MNRESELKKEAVTNTKCFVLQNAGETQRVDDVDTGRFTCFIRSGWEIH